MRRALERAEVTQPAPEDAPEVPKAPDLPEPGEPTLPVAPAEPVTPVDPTPERQVPEPAGPEVE